MSAKNYSLSELTSHIENVIKVNFSEPIWIRAEISELREKGGHCYLELIEKDEKSDALKARVRATIWAGSYRLLKPFFEESTGQALRSGLSLLAAVMVEFHGMYGINLIVKDIDPSFTLGAQAKRRMEIIRKLESDGVMEMNKMLELTSTPQRIAVISSATAAGYDDFINQLHQHPSQFAFYTRLFPSIMQGEQASASIIGSLEVIYEQIENFDAVVIIRGGGATTDLACFDDYELALNCAQFPLPIIAGIGHQRDLSIVDMVVHSSVKTPTAAAALLTDKLSGAYDNASRLYQNIIHLSTSMVKNQQQRLTDFRWKLKSVLTNKSRDKFIELEQLKMRLRAGIGTVITLHNNRLVLYRSKLEKHSPAAMLKYGYTLTTQSGRRISSVHQLNHDLPLTTYFPDGKINSRIDGEKEEL
jgi:exodeoxyribonuclease VII large subunit